MEQFRSLRTYVEATYSGIGKIKEFRILPHSNINSKNYFFRTTKGRYVLKKVVHGRHANLERMCEILAFCISRGVKVPEPLRIGPDQYVHPKNNSFVLRFYRGIPFNGSREQLKDIGKELGILHRVLSQYPISYPWKPEERGYRHLKKSELERVRNLIKRARQRDRFDLLVGEHLPLIESLYAWCAQRVSFEKEGFARGKLIHGDMQPGNVLFWGNKVKVILDFGATRRGSPFSELAFAAFRFSLADHGDGREARKRVNTFVHSYLKENAIPGASFSTLQYCFIFETLDRISNLLRLAYGRGSFPWPPEELEKHIRFLQIAREMR
ncbi:MAG: phosphotransferase [Patescibacteria group bacterium]